MKSLTDENANLKKDLAAAKTAAASAGAASGAASADAKALADANAKVKSLTDENANLKKDLAAAKKGSLPLAVPVRSEADAKALSDADAKIQSLTDANSKLKSDLDAAKKTLSASSDAKALTDANAKVQSLTEANAKLTADLNAQKSAAQKASEDAAKTTGTLNEANAKLKVLMDENAKLTADLTAQKAANEKASADLAAAKQAAEEAANRPVPSDAAEKIASLTQEKAKLQNDLVSAQAELDAAKAKAEKSAAASVSVTALAAAEKRASELESDVTKLNAEVKALAEQNKKLEAGEAVRKTLEEENKALADSKAASDKQIADLKAQIAKFSAPDSSDAPELAKQKELNASLSASVEKLNAEKTASAEALAKANKDLVATQAQLEKLKIDQASNAEVRKLTESLADSNALLKKSNDERDTLAKESAAYKERCEALQNTLSSLLTQQTALNAKLQRLEKEVELRRRDPKAAGSAEIQEKNDSIAELLKERAAFDEQIAGLKAELDDERALSSRYKRTMNAARSVAEAAIVESRTLRAELDTYRRNDPDAKPEVGRTEDTIPEELKPMFEEIMSGNDGKTTLVVDKIKFEEAMKEAQRAENAKDFTGALWHYLTAADADPTNSSAQISLARIHYALKHAENALKAYEKALQLGAKRDPSLEQLLKAAQGTSDK